METTMVEYTTVSQTKASKEFTNVCSNFFCCQLQIWDTAGEERYRQGGLTSSFYRGAHGALIVFSLTSLKSFENIKKLWVDEFYRKRY